MTRIPNRDDFTVSLHTFPQPVKTLVESRQFPHFPWRASSEPAGSEVSLELGDLVDVNKIKVSHEQAVRLSTCGRKSPQHPHALSGTTRVRLAT
jgi:hypothetical protein